MNKLIYFILLFARCVIFIQAEDINKYSWNDFMSKATWATNRFVGNIEPSVIKYLHSGNISESCVKGMGLYFEGLRKWQPWAVEMADSTGRIPSGLLKGTMMDFGSYDQCLQVRAEFKDRKAFRGKYCTIAFSSSFMHQLDSKTQSGKTYEEAYGSPPDWIIGFLKKNKPLLKKTVICLGVCLPSTCSADDIYSFLSIATIPWISDILISNCQDDLPKPWPTSARIAISILSCLFGICLLGTILDLRKRGQMEKNKETSLASNEGFAVKLLKSFSLSTNSSKVFETREKTNPFNSLDGYRFFLSAWLIVCHEFGYMTHMKEWRFSSSVNVFDMFGFLTVILENSYLFMEDFCVISGLLLVSTIRNKMERNEGKINLFEFIIKKYFRMLPAFLFYLVIIYAIPVMRHGPTWNSTWALEQAKCQKTWWSNMLFVQNFQHVDDLCILHSWFLGNLMQLQIVGVILLLIIFRFPKIGVSLCSIVIALSIWIVYSTSLTSEFYMLHTHHLKDVEMLKDIISYIYLRPFNHISSFILGMLLAWIFLKYKNVKLSKTFRTICWIASITLYTLAMCVCLLPTRNFRIISAYYALRTLGWGLSTSWILFSLFTGTAGVLNKILESKVFVPLARISYSIYAIHPLVLIYKDAVQRERRYLGIDDLIFDSVALIVISIGVAFIAYITIELPFTTIYYLLKEKCTSLLTFTNKSKYAIHADKNKFVQKSGKYSCETKAKKH